jgi:hypothetical protein
MVNIYLPLTEQTKDQNDLLILILINDSCYEYDCFLRCII